jgi:putative transposase
MYDWQNKKKFAVVNTCKVLKVSETGYYKWKRTGNKPKAWQLLLVKIHEILDEHPDNKNYGIDRIMIALEQKYEKYSRSTVIRAMRKGNLLHESHRSPDGLTKADKKALQPENLLNQDFRASKPNEKWLTDITQVSCLDGKLYIAPIFDCFGGEIISLSMERNMKKELCIQAVNEAYRIRKPGSGVIIHSDAGSQYTSGEYKKMLGDYHAVQSMSGVGKCYDNSRMESFFATLKKEKLYQINTQKMTVNDVKAVVWRYVMIYYNRYRISTVNKDGLPPTMFRLQKTKLRACA